MPSLIERVGRFQAWLRAWLHDFVRDHLVLAIVLALAPVIGISVGISAWLIEDAQGEQIEDVQQARLEECQHGNDDRRKILRYLEDQNETTLDFINGLIRDPSSLSPQVREAIESFNMDLPAQVDELAQVFQQVDCEERVRTGNG